MFSCLSWFNFWINWKTRKTIESKVKYIQRKANQQSCKRRKPKSTKNWVKLNSNSLTWGSNDKSWSKKRRVKMSEKSVLLLKEFKVEFDCFLVHDGLEFKFIKCYTLYPWINSIHSQESLSCVLCNKIEWNFSSFFPSSFAFSLFSKSFCSFGYQLNLCVVLSSRLFKLLPLKWQVNFILLLLWL